MNAPPPPTTPKAPSSPPLSLCLSLSLPPSLSLSVCDAAAPVVSPVSSKQQSWRQWSNRSPWIEVRRSQLFLSPLPPSRVHFHPSLSFARLLRFGKLRRGSVGPAPIHVLLSVRDFAFLRVVIPTQHELRIKKKKSPSRLSAPCVHFY